MLNNGGDLRGTGGGHLEVSLATGSFSHGGSPSKEHRVPSHVLSHPELSTPCPRVGEG